MKFVLDRNRTTIRMSPAVTTSTVYDPAPDYEIPKSIVSKRIQGKGTKKNGLTLRTQRSGAFIAMFHSCILHYDINPNAVSQCLPCFLIYQFSSFI